MRSPALAALLILALAVATAYAQSGQNQSNYFKVHIPAIVVTGGEGTPGNCTNWCPAAKSGEKLECNYTTTSTSGSRSASWFEMGLNLKYRVETGFPRTDKSQYAKGGSGVAAQWAEPKSLKTDYKVQAEIYYNAPTSWKYKVETYTYNCYYYNASNTTQLLRTETVTKSFVSEFKPDGWTSGRESCELKALDEEGQAEYTCTVQVPWYGSNTVSPGDFSADYWANGVMPKANASNFGTYSMKILHKYIDGTGPIRFLRMSDLVPRRYNTNTDDTTEDVYMKNDYFKFVWYIVKGAKKEINVNIIADFGKGGAGNLTKVYPETSLKWTFGEKSGEVKEAPDSGNFTIQTTGIPFRFDPDLHVLPPKWGNVIVAPPRPATPHVEVKTFSLVREGDKWYTYIGFDPTTCRPQNAKPVSTLITPKHLDEAGPRKNSEANQYLQLLIENVTSVYLASASVVAHIYKQVNSMCWAFAVAYVVSVSQGSTRAYVDDASISPVVAGLLGYYGYWYFPAGGVSKSRFRAEFNLTFMASKGQVKSGTEGIEIVHGGFGFQYVCDSGYCYVDVDLIRDFFTWFAVKSGSWPYVYVALDEDKKDKLSPLSDRALVPMASITFGDTPYVYHTPIGDLTIPKEVMPNTYGIWSEDFPYYPASFSAAMKLVNSAVPTYTPLTLERPLEFWLAWATGTVIRNLGKHNKDFIGQERRVYSDASHNGGIWMGPTAPIGSVVRHDVEPAVMKPPEPPPDNNTKPPGPCELPNPPPWCFPKPPPPTYSSRLIIWLVPVVPCSGVYCYGTSNMLIGYLDQYALPGRAYTLYVVPQSLNETAFSADVEIWVQADAVRNGSVWRTSKRVGHPERFLYFRGRLNFTTAADVGYLLIGNYSIRVPVRDIYSYTGRTVDRVSYFIAPWFNISSTSYRVYYIKVKTGAPLNKEFDFAYYVTRLLLNGTYYTKLADRLDYVKTAFDAVAYHDLNTTSAPAAYRPEFVLHGPYTEVGAGRYSWVMLASYLHVMYQYALSDLLLYNAS